MSRTSPQPSTHETKRWTWRNWPRAATLAAFLVGLCELAVRQLPMEQYIRTDLGTSEYLALRAAIQDGMTREFVLVGSSRTLQGVDLEDFSDQLHARVGGNWRVGSHAVNGALTTETVAILQYMLSQPPLPRALAWGLSVDELRGDDLVSDRSVLFADLATWWQDRRELGNVMTPYWPDAVRTNLSEMTTLFRYQWMPVIYVKDQGREKAPRAFLGESLGRHTDETTLQDSPELRRDIRGRFNDWHFYQPDYTFNAEKIARIKKVLQAYRERGTEVLLFEVPNAPEFDEELPEPVRQLTEQTLRQIAADTGASYVTMTDLQLSFTTAEFYDTVHLKAAGAQRYTAALAKHVPQSLLEAAAK